MKKLFFFVLLNLCFCVYGAAQEIDKTPSITVTGTAEVEVMPDEVTFTLDVTKLDKDLQAAKRQNDESVGKILELARRFAVPTQNVKTDYITVEMKYESIRDAKTKVFNDSGDEIGKRIFKGYSVSKTVIVKLTDISKFDEFFSEVLKTGLSEISSVKFSTSKLRENKDKARDLAMKAAREKASAMSTSVGQTIGKAIRITEWNIGTPNYSSNSNISNVNEVSQNVATFALGTIKVEAQVSVTFLLN